MTPESGKKSYGTTWRLHEREVDGLQKDLLQREIFAHNITVPVDTDGDNLDESLLSLQETFRTNRDIYSNMFQHTGEP